MKYELILCCDLTPLQETIYRKIIERNRKNLSVDGKSGGGITGTTLSFITNLKKLCNHPQLIYDKCKNNEPGFEGYLNIVVKNF